MGWCPISMPEDTCESRMSNRVTGKEVQIHPPDTEGNKIFSTYAALM